jgi:exoribonuclease-2
VERLESVIGEECDSGRRDLRGDPVFTVDEPTTLDLDDGISCRRDASGTLHVGIHIADPSTLVRPGDPVDREAASRGTSHYLPEMKVPMVPAAISEQAASLLPGRDRLALSFLVHFAPTGERMSVEVVPSVVRSLGRVSYDEANAVLSGEDVSVREEMRESLVALWEIASHLEAERLAAGAVRIMAPEVDARPDERGGVSLVRVSADRPGRRLVAEMMVLAGRLTAEYCLAHGVPVLFRRQAPPEEPVTSPPVGEYDPVAVRKARRAMRRSEVGTVPGAHSGLGLQAYVQATSPLRRYSDLVAHRQVAAHLSGRTPPYDAEALLRIAATSDEAERQARIAERGSREYWLLRYLEPKAGCPVEAVITDTAARRTDVELCETLLPSTIPARPDHRPGQQVRCVIERVVPRGPLLSLREA